MFPCTAGVDLFPCCVDIHGIVSTHVETCCLLEQQKSAKDFFEIGIDAEEYYRIKDSETAADEK